MLAQHAKQCLVPKGSNVVVEGEAGEEHPGVWGF